VTRVSSVIERRESATHGKRLTESRLLLIGGASFALVLLGWAVYAVTHAAPRTVDPADLRVYRDGGLIIRHVSPPYHARFRYPLYDWPLRKAALKFTCPPFAAVFFVAISYIPWSVLPRLSQAVNLLLLVAAAWCTTGALADSPGDGCRQWRRRLGGALLGAAAALLTEPVFRTMYLGQVNLLLMALIIGDLGQPDGRRLKGAAVGIAAGIKLVPLVFIPYLLLTGRLRAAAVAVSAFAATVILGFAVVPGDSADWWLHGLFVDGARARFVGWGGNQSLRAILTRLAGPIHGAIHDATVEWVSVALLVAVVGLTSAVLLDRAGHAMLAILATALVGLLDSPVSCDYHWVWVMPGMMAAACYASRAWQAGQRSAARWAAALAGALLLIFTAWPGALWMSGSAFVLAGVALLALLALVAATTRHDAAVRRA
jgi:alpha-1,2-mannosyltransferase